MVRPRNSSTCCWSGRTALPSACRVRFQSSSDSSSSSSPRNNKNNETTAPPAPADASEEWIPPERPLVGDRGQSHVYTHVEDKQIEKELDELDLAEMSKKLDYDDDAFEEWIPPEKPAAASAAALVGAGDGTDNTGTDQQKHLDIVVERTIETELEQLDLTTEKEQDPAGSSSTTTTEEPSSGGPDWLKTRRAMLEGMQMMKPDDSAAARHQLSDIPVKRHTLLTRKEIAVCLESMGGQDVVCVLDNPQKPRMGGATGIIIVTGSNQPQLRTLAETLLRQLRLRSLQDVGCVAAAEGIEGDVRSPDEDWMVVDCMNYIVHVQLARTRKALDLEGLWTGRDGIHKVDLDNEDEVDDYVAANPVPKWYTSGTSPVAVDWEREVKKLKKSRFARTTLSARKSDGRMRGAGRRR